VKGSISFPVSRTTSRARFLLAIMQWRGGREEAEEEAQVRRWYLLHNRIIFAPRSAG